MGAPKNAKNSRRSRSGISASSDVIFVGGIPRGATQCDLREFFQELVGDVKKVRFVIDRTTRSHRGFGFVRFRNEASVMKVLAMKDSLMLRGKLLNVGVTEGAATGSDSASSGQSPVEDDEDGLTDLPELEDDMDIDTEVVEEVIPQAVPQQVVYQQAMPQMVPVGYVPVQPMQWAMPQQMVPQVVYAVRAY